MWPWWETASTTRAPWPGPMWAVVWAPTQAPFATPPTSPFCRPIPGRLFDALKLSVLFTRTIRQNIFFAFFYNAVAIPAAAAGLLSPLIAVSAMFLSSLMVTGNALRISSRGLPSGRAPAA